MQLSKRQIEKMEKPDSVKIKGKKHRKRETKK